MGQEFNVLIIDDHPLISEAYKSAFSQVTKKDENTTFKISVADNCDDANDRIIEASKEKTIDIVFLDMKLPPSEKKGILSGEDLGIKIKKLLPDTKVIVSTTYNDNYRIHSIFKSINPEGFLIKNDISPQELVSSIETVIKDPPYYSQTVIKLLRKEVANEFILDKIDRQLLYELSIGTKMKDLPKILPLSIAGVEKRKRILREMFDVNKKGDKELVKIAREKGFI